MAGANLNFPLVINGMCSWKTFFNTKTMQIFGIKP